MATATTPATDAKRELEEACERLRKGVHDPEVARRARERMDRMREELRERIGIVDVAVDLVRDARQSI
jgi:hypothetical protein